MSRDELEPCPFCGGEAERIDFSAEDQADPNAGGSCISCERCGASSPVHFDRKENLLSSWNQRATLTSPRELVLREALAPFAEMAVSIRGDLPDTFQVGLKEAGVRLITLGDLRRAQAAHAALSGQSGEALGQQHE